MRRVDNREVRREQGRWPARFAWLRAGLYLLFLTVAVMGGLWLNGEGGIWIRLLLTEPMAALSTSGAVSPPPSEGSTASTSQPEASLSSEPETSPPSATKPPEEEKPFTFAWMSDTQLYSESWPQIFRRMTGWLAENREKENIQMLFHTGDVVNNRNSEAQWNNAVEAMSLLDGLPYLIATGNHDVGTPTGDYSRFSPRFGANVPPGGETWEEGKGQYALFSMNGMDFLMVFLGYGTEEEGTAWAAEILSRYPDRYAILGVHSYMHDTGALTTIGKGYYNALVVPHANVRLVLCGHHHSAGKRETPLDDDGDGETDRTVIQLLADYQAAGEGGGGFLRLLTFDTAAGLLKVHTYSPYLDKTSYYEDPTVDTFEVPIDWP